MPRVLVMAERVVSESERDTYFNTLAARRERATAASANFWAFEQQQQPGLFLEFVEAGTPASLHAAVLAVLDRDLALSVSRPVWSEVAVPEARDIP